MFAGRVKIVSHSSCRTSAILKYFCPLHVISIIITKANNRETDQTKKTHSVCFHGESTLVFASMGRELWSAFKYMQHR